MRTVRGLGTAAALFLAAFMLHVVAGVTDVAWLFATAVAVIAVSAVFFPLIAVLASGAAPGSADHRRTWRSGCCIGVALTMATLWAANGRDFAWWHMTASVAGAALAAAPAILAERRAEAAGRHAEQG